MWKTLLIFVVLQLVAPPWAFAAELRKAENENCAWRIEGPPTRGDARTHQSGPWIEVQSADRAIGRFAKHQILLLRHTRRDCLSQHFRWSSFRGSFTYAVLQRTRAGERSSTTEMYASPRAASRSWEEHRISMTESPPVPHASCSRSAWVRPSQFVCCRSGWLVRATKHHGCSCGRYVG